VFARYPYRVKEQNLAMESSIAALDELKLDSAEGFARVVVGDKEASKYVTAFVQERCIPQELQHLLYCCTCFLHLHTQCHECPAETKTS
jgi:hypothetical protein